MLELIISPPIDLSFAGANVANKGNSFHGGWGGRISFLFIY